MYINNLLGRSIYSLEKAAGETAINSFYPQDNASQKIITSNTGTYFRVAK
jgi:hypothetical protein